MRIIINADDFGMSSSVNEAIIQLFQMGLLDRCSIMVNMPNVDKLIDRSDIQLGLFNRIGLHINLTEGKPLTHGMYKTLFCDDHEKLTTNNVSLLNRIFLNSNVKNAVLEEIEAQMALFLRMGLPLRHIDSHNYSSGDYSISKLVIPLAEKYGFTSIRLAKNIKSSENYGLKLFYRRIVNMRISSFNRRNKSSEASNLFGSLRDVTEYLSSVEASDECIELMVHPYLRKDGVIIDHYTYEELIEPLSQLKKI